MEISKVLVTLDLETTGVWVDHDKIIEIALIKSYPDGKEEIFNKKVNPSIRIPKIVTQLTGIGNEDVANECKFYEIAQEVLDFIGEAEIAGYNIEKFDLPLLEREINESGLQFNWRNHKIYDAQKAYHINEKRDLTAAYKFYCKKELINAHSALADTKATLEIIKNQVAQYGEGNNNIEILDNFQYKKDENFYDDQRKFRWWNGKLYMMFGKYARKYTLQEVAKKDRKYLQWILSADFSEDIKILINNALIGKFPIPDGIFDDKGQASLF